MLIEYTGRRTDVTPKLRARAERRLRKLAKMLRTITHAHVTFTVDKHRQTAEVVLHSPHLDLTAREETADMVASLDAVIDKLERQAQKHAGKRKERKRQGPVRGVASARRAGAAWTEPPAPPAPAPRRPRLRARRVVPRPMTVDAAMAELEASKDGLVVFRDADIGRLAVLFRRNDGTLGLVEPEA
jgi:putative sigma-54 modulation protein